MAYDPTKLLALHKQTGVYGDADPYAKLLGGSGILGQANQAGFFNPMGSQQLMAQLRAGALRNAQNRQRRGSVLAQISGLSPEGQRAGMFDIERQTGGDISSALSGAQLQQLLGNQDWARGLLGQERGYQQQQQMARLMAHLQKQQQGGFGGMFGGLLGTGLGGLLGGPFGAALGGQLFGGGGGGGGGGSWNPYTRAY